LRAALFFIANTNKAPGVGEKACQAPYSMLVHLIESEIAAAPSL